MVKTYRCKYSEYKIVVKPAVFASAGIPSQKGEYIQFQNGLFVTDNEQYQQIIENNSLFGVKLFLDNNEETESENQEAPKRRGNPNFVKKTQAEG